jgi:hypothetical protein
MILVFKELHFASAAGGFGVIGALALGRQSTPALFEPQTTGRNASWGGDWSQIVR